MDSSMAGDPTYSWEKNRKRIFRALSLGFGTLATLMALSVLDGRMAYLQGAYTGYVGFWINCQRHQCASLDQVTVLIHMSMGFMMLALALCLVLVPTMALSFQSVFHRLKKIDLVFSLLSLTSGLLILLSMTLFVINCETLKSRPKVTYTVTAYLCWGASALMLFTGTLSYLNYAGKWAQRQISWERRVSYRLWDSRQSYLKHKARQQSVQLSVQQSVADSEQTADRPQAPSL